MNFHGQARWIGLKYATLGLLLAALVPVLLARPSIIRFWYLPWRYQLATAVLVVVVIVWCGAPKVFREVARNRNSRAPMGLAFLAFVSAGFTGSASTLVLDGIRVDLASFSTYVLGPLTWLLLLGSPLCLLIGLLYRRELRARGTRSPSPS